MGKKIRLREARRRLAAEDLAARLQAHNRLGTGPASVESFPEFDAAYRDKIERFRHLALREPESWRPRLKSRSADRRFLELVQFTFARYPVAGHLANAWLGAYAPTGRGAAPADASVELRSWYVHAGAGGSLYRHATHAFMSKQETHHFLHPPREVVSARSAFWYAFARPQAADASAALKIARTKLVDCPHASRFWQEAARYFARNPISIQEMDDFVDFFHAALQDDDSFSLKGRSLPALRRRREDWHRMLRRRATIGGGSWDGSALPDAEYEAHAGDRQAIWRFTQIKTGNDLFKEGQRMRHCVATYKEHCLEGRTSIWSVTCEYPIGQVNRSVTLELREGNRIAQCRGFANRAPYDNEATIVKRWAADNGLTCTALQRP